MNAFLVGCLFLKKRSFGSRQEEKHLRFEKFIK